MIIKMDKIYFLLIVFCIACSNNQQSIEIKEIKNGNLHTIEKGVLINGIRDGYWITVEEDSRFIKIESYYKNDVLNGPIKLYTDDGLLMS
jgi:antitoxin component YwqK of YwqJK toxin-antitoxin module